MSRSLEEQIRNAFAEGYREPAQDLRKALWEPRRPRRRAGSVALRMGALLVTATLVAVGISLPRVAGPRPAPASGFSPVLPDFGYVVVASAQDLSGRGGPRTLGVVPPGRRYGVIVQSRCASRWVRPLPKVEGGAAAADNLLLGVLGGRRGLFLFATARSSKPTLCRSALGAGAGGSSGLGGPTSASGPEAFSVRSAPGIAWRAYLEVYTGPGQPAMLPSVLGTCSARDLGWSFGPGKRSGSAVDFSLTPEGDSVVPPCQLLLPVRLGLYEGGTTLPLRVSGNSAAATLAGRYQGGPGGPTLRWRWTNWCGPQRRVQAAFIAPGGAVIGATSAPVPLPVCTNPSRPSRLVLSP
ncbi:MAG: hypothetical protein WBU92_07650 [Candidatus Dormiibacterota bacterium]